MLIPRTITSRLRWSEYFSLGGKSNPRLCDDLHRPPTKYRKLNVIFAGANSNEPNFLELRMENQFDIRLGVRVSLALILSN